MIRDVAMIAHMKPGNPAKALDRACAEFETLFAHQLLKTMSSSVPEGFMDGGFASDVYRDMFYRKWPGPWGNPGPWASGTR
jgi:Rod binding domain-containing protein